MTIEEFREVVSGEADLARPIQRAARAAGPAQYGAITQAAVWALMFPVVSFILTSVGLPWLHEAGRFLELYRQRFHRWIDERYREAGLDPDAAEAAGDALRNELERTTDAGARAAWERLAELLIGSSGAV